MSKFWLNNIYIAYMPLNKVIKRKFYKQDSEFFSSLNLSSFANFNLSFIISISLAISFLMLS